MMNKIVLYISLLLLLMMSATVSQAEELSAWEMWKAGYEVYGKAEHDKLTGKNSAALSGFQQARDYYQKIKKLQPNWQQNKINERISMCERQITKLLNAMNSSARSNSTQTYRPKTYSKKRTLPDDDVYRPARKTYSPNTYQPKRTAPSLNTESDIYRPGRSASSTVAELAAYRKKYITAQLELEDLKKQLARSLSTARQVESIIREKSFLEEQYNRLLSKYDKLRGQGGASAEEISNLRNRLVAEKMRSEQTAKKLTMQTQKADEYNQELDALRRYRTSTRSTLDRDRKKLAELEAKISGLNDKMALADRDKRNAEVKKTSLTYSLEQSEKRSSAMRLTYEKLLKSIKQKSAKSPNGKVSMVLSDENLRLATQMKKTNEQNDKLLNEQRELKARLRNADIDTTRLKDTISSVKSSYLTLRKEYARVLRASTGAAGAGAIDQSKITQLQKKNRELADELRRFAVRMNNIRAGDNVAEQYKDIITRLNKRLTSQRELLSAKEADFTRLEKRLNNYTVSNAQMSLDVKKLQSENADMNEEIKLIDILKKDIVNLRKEKSKLAATANNIKELTIKHSKLEAEYKRVQSKMLTSGGEIMKLQDEAVKLKRDLADYPAMKKEVAAARKQLQKPPKGSLLQMQQKITSQEKQITGLQGSLVELNRLRGEFNRLKDYTAEFAIAQKQLATVRKQLKDASTSVDSSLHANTVLKKRLAVLQKKDDTLQAKLRALKKQLSAVGKQNADMKKNIKQLQGKLVATEKIAKTSRDLKSAQAVIKKKLNDAEQTAAQLKKQKQSLTREVSKLKKRQTAEAVIKKKLNDAEQAAAQLKKQKQSLAQEVSKLKKQQTKVSISKVQRAKMRKKFNYLFAEAVAAAGRNDLKTAEWHYRQALKLIPEDPHATAGLGRTMLLRGKGADAYPLLNSASKQLPPSAELDIYTSQAALAAGRKVEAVKLAKSAMKLDTASGPAVAALVNALLKSNQLSKAEQVLEDAKRGLGKDPYIELAQARVSLRKGPAFKLQAIEAYSLARKGGVPEDSELEAFLKKIRPTKKAIDNLAFLRQSAADAATRKDYDSAVWFSSQVVAKDGKSTTALYEHATYSLLGGKNDEAKKALSKARGLDNKHAGILYLQAAVAIREGNFSDAVRNLRDVVKLVKKPQSPTPYERKINARSLKLIEKNLKSGKPDKYAGATAEFIKKISGK
jgi:uncharacterized coiled-coil DUF342 family protein/predicted  nucleic acid-binding Zn-ribbon protein